MRREAARVGQAFTRGERAAREARESGGAAGARGLLVVNKTILSLQLDVFPRILHAPIDVVIVIAQMILFKIG